jgi:hypothetical protein
MSATIAAADQNIQLNSDYIHVEYYRLDDLWGDDATNANAYGANAIRFFNGIDPMAGRLYALISPRAPGAVSAANYAANWSVFWPATVRTVRYVEVDSINWGDRMWFEDSMATDFTEQSLIDAGLSIRVHYMGTNETRVRTTQDIQRWVGFGRSEIFASPNFASITEGPEAVFATLTYFENQSYLNMPVNIQVPTGEFMDEIMFRRRDLTTDKPFQIMGRATAGQNMNLEEFRGLTQNYDLVGVYDFQGRQVFRVIPSQFATPAGPFVLAWMLNSDNSDALHHESDEEVEMKEFTAVIPVGYLGPWAPIANGATRWGGSFAEVELEVIPNL